MSKLFIFVFIISFTIFNCSNDKKIPTTFVSSDDSSNITDSTHLNGSADLTKKFVTIDGINFVDTNGNPIIFKGVAFGNEVWYNGGVPTVHHSKVDYQRVRDMGMDLIRFYMNTETFEDYDNPYTYKEDGWAWLDSNISWAKKYGIYLNLNVHVPQGGFQSNGDGDALWDDMENQKRLISFWKTIAKRYVNESQIISFDLLNEPGVTKSKLQWKELAQNIIDSIRSVDTNHIIIVERVNSVAKDWEVDKDYNFVEVNDPLKKLAYEFHFYEPIEYTHQNTSWTGLGDGGSYPDNSIVTIVGAEWVGEGKSVILPAGDTDWKEYRGKKVTVMKEKYLVGKPAFESSSISDGVAYLDNIYIIDYDENGDSIGVIGSLEVEDLSGFWLWSDAGDGNMSLVNDTINGGKKVVSITGCSSLANAGDNNLRFKTTIGHSYQIVAWMRGEGIPSSASVGMKFDFEYSETGVSSRDKEYLKGLLSNYIDWIHAKGVPAYLGEFGLYKDCFNGKGGLQWVSDMLDILAKKNCSYTYHAYHEDSFGIYYDNSKLPNPANANTELIKLFTDKLN